MDRADEDQSLETRRLKKMAGTAHAFVRDDTLRHDEWLGGLPAIIGGRPVWICGDCHVGTVGPIADDHERIAYLERCRASSKKTAE